jgi:hypothetical protein
LNSEATANYACDELDEDGKKREIRVGFPGGKGSMLPCSLQKAISENELVKTFAWGSSDSVCGSRSQATNYKWIPTPETCVPVTCGAVNTQLNATFQHIQNGLDHPERKRLPDLERAYAPICCDGYKHPAHLCKAGTTLKPEIVSHNYCSNFDHLKNDDHIYNENAQACAANSAASGDNNNQLALVTCRELNRHLDPAMEYRPVSDTGRTKDNSCSVDDHESCVFHQGWNLTPEEKKAAILMYAPICCDGYKHPAHLCKAGTTLKPEVVAHHDCKTFLPFVKKDTDHRAPAGVTQADCTGK